MSNTQVLAVLAELQGNEHVRIYPDADLVFTPLFQPEEPFETTVDRVVETHHEHFPYAEEHSKVAGRRECFEREVVLEPHPDAGDAEYVTYHRTWGEGDEITGGTLYSRNYFAGSGESTPTEAEVAHIEYVEVLA